MSTEAPALPRPHGLRRAATIRLQARPTAAYVVGVLAVAAAYYGAAKVGQSLRYTGSVSAIWPPAGVGIAVLYLFGLRWWPGVFVAELVLNAELVFFDEPALPVVSAIGQWAGNMAEIVVGAILLRRLIGPRAALNRVDQVVGMLVALGTATAISATFGMTAMLAGGVIDHGEMPTFWRTWWLGDTAGGLVVLPLALTWAANPVAAWRRVATWEGGLMLASVVALGAISVSVEDPVTYLVFPALVWAAFRFGPPGATLAVAIAALLAIGITANEVGPFFKQPIDHQTLSTQVYVFVAALTTLFLSAVVSERERSGRELAEAKQREDQRAVEERRRIARDLHDSVSQALFSTLLHTRTAQRALARGEPITGSVARSLSAIGELTRGAQSEMRDLIFELRRSQVEDGLVAALAQHGSRLAMRDGLTVDVQGSQRRLGLSARAENQLFGIGREALANVLKHSGASTAWVRVEALPERVVVEIRDDGRGFDPGDGHPGHFGLESMRSRAAEIGATLTITSTRGYGTVVRVEAPLATEPSTNGG
jgi:signal transduction histidine kinase